MKKQLFSLLGAGALLLGLTTGCSSESIEPAAGDDGTVSFTLTLPSGISSRAYSDGLTATKLTYAVYDAAATEIKPIIKETVTPFNGGLTGTVSFKLVTGKTYDILFWADSYGGTTPYEFDANTQTIKVDYTNAESCDENRDAFFAARTGLKVTGPVSETITLTRPFAQINFGSDDLDEPTVKDMTSLKAKVTTKAYSTLNLKDGSVTGEPVDVTFSAAEFPTAESFPYEPATYGYVSMNYLLVKDTKETLDQLVLTIENDGAEVNTVTVPNAPVQRNYRTNIYGSLLTSTALFNIIIEPNFSGMYNNGIGGGVELAKAASEGGYFTLTADIDLTETINVASGVETVINLNGHNITSSSDCVFKVSGNLTINGDENTTVTGASGMDANAVTALTGGTVTINGGNYTVGADANNLGNSCIYSYGGTIIINEGTFSTAAQWNNKYYVLNLKNDMNGSITCYGGTFIGQDPAGGDDVQQPTNFVAEGYESVKTDTVDGVDAWKVQKKATD